MALKCPKSFVLAGREDNKQKKNRFLQPIPSNVTHHPARHRAPLPIPKAVAFSQVLYGLPTSNTPRVCKISDFLLLGRILYYLQERGTHIALGRGGTILQKKKIRLGTPGRDPVTCIPRLLKIQARFGRSKGMTSLQVPKPFGPPCNKDALPREMEAHYVGTVLYCLVLSMFGVITTLKRKQSQDKL